MGLCVIWAGIEREMVNYINAHATSTPVGDISEIKALRQVFSNSPNLTVNGTKSMVLSFAWQNLSTHVSCFCSWGIR